MKEIDATRLKLKAMEMVEATNILWWEVIKVCGRISNVPLCFCDPKENYELALGIVEGRPVWEGDELYLDGVKRIFFEGFTDGWSWIPPKPRTIPVELPLETVKFIAETLGDYGGHYKILFSACHDVLEKQTSIKYKGSLNINGGSISVPGFDHTGVTSK